MATTPTETSTGQSSSPTLEELTRQTAGTMILPRIVGYVARVVTPSQQTREVIVIVNARSGSMSVIDGAVNLETFLREKLGPLPASKASIDAMPIVKVVEKGLECAICLADFDIGEEAREMPCKHRYHSNCIEKWLGMRGSCPICRYSMPMEGVGSNRKEGEGEGSIYHAEGQAQTEADAQEEEREVEGEEEDVEEGRGGPSFGFHVYQSGRRVRRRRTYSETETDPIWNLSRGGDATAENSGSIGDANVSSSTQDMVIDGGPTAQNMDIEESRL